MFPEWHHAVPESAYLKVPETLKTFRMYSTSRYAPCATRLYGVRLGFLSDQALIAAHAHTRGLYLVQRGNREQRYWYPTRK